MSSIDPGQGWVDPNPPDAGNPASTPALAISAVALVLVVIAALVGVVMASHGGAFDDGPEKQSLMLTAANARTAEPFMPSVVVGATPVAQNAADRAAALLTGLPVSSARGVRLVPGTQPGLYGVVGQGNACDVAAVANALDAHPEQAGGWAEALGIDAPRIPYYLNALTPVVLTADTWVTAHNWSDGRSERFQQVLQAGSAVLIDRAGVPRVHCASGDPLRPPANQDFAAFELEGERWSGFNAENVVAVAYTNKETPQPAVDEFTVLDLASGELVNRRAGATIQLGDDPAGPLPDPAGMNVPPPARSR